MSAARSGHADGDTVVDHDEDPMDAGRSRRASTSARAGLSGE
jgi:hypothetical protein